MPTFDSFENRNTLAKQAKRALRQQMRELRASIPASVLARQSKQVQRHLMTLPAFGDAGTIALCAVPPLHRGVDLSQLATRAHAMGKSIVYPRLDFDLQQVHFAPASRSALCANGLERAEATPDASPISPDALDLIVVPVLAVDPTGTFIGDGSGTYDHVLQRISRAIAVAVSFEFQLIPEAPCTSEDVPVAVIVTDQRVIEARGERRDEDVTHGSFSTGRAKEVRRAKQPDSIAGPCHPGSPGNWTRSRIGESS